MLRHLVARRFRNLESLDWEVDPGFHLLLGGTGAGKTSVLEAIYAVATTRSFRTSQLADCARRTPQDEERDREAGDPGGFFLAAETSGEPRARLELAWTPARGLERRLNGDRVALAQHLSAQPVLVWTSAEVEMLLGSPVARRRFLDRGVIYRHPASLHVFASFRSLLGQKRSLLRAGGGRREIAAWNALLAEAVAAIAAQRQAFAGLLEQALAAAVRRSGLAFEEVLVRYRPSPPEAPAGVEAVLAALDVAIPAETQARRPLVGPHRDRLVLRWQGEELAQRASAGERKTIGLLLLAAQASVIEAAGAPAIVLVDDADAELDRASLRAVWPVLADRPQVLASSNRPEVWEGLDAGARWRLEAGRVVAWN